MRAGLKRTAAGWNSGTSKCKAASNACCPSSIERSFSRLPGRPITASPSPSSGRRIFGGDQSRFIFTPMDARTREHHLTRRDSIPRSGRSGRVGATDLRRPRQRQVGAVATSCSPSPWHWRWRHALPVQPDFADAFDAGEDLIDSLAADAHQLSADDAGHEIARKVENFLWLRALCRESRPWSG